ncbi:MAG: DUF934 domain-containing protein [Hydrogenophaga sp.]|jgi:uncharacterized protein (DUF934 family)|nr:DUF934 domain-containing protein [Hydrogenophaga sp.]
MPSTIQLFSAETFVQPDDSGVVLVLANHEDPRETRLEGVTAVELQFPKFSDGRAFSQAFLLRRRLGFTGHIRATGDVLIDQLLQMQRSGFTQAVLRTDQNLAHGQALLTHYAAFYQGDALRPEPRFAAA